MLRSSYVEIVGVIDPTLFTNRLTELLDRYEGIHAVVFACDDASVAQAVLTSAGFSVPSPERLERVVDTSGGPRRARFDVLRMRAEEMPEGRILVVQHHTPELLWQPQFLGHPNTAVELSEVLLAVSNVVDAAARYERFLRLGPEEDGASVMFTTPHGRLRLLQAGARSPGQDACPSRTGAVGIVVRVGDLDAARSVLRNNGVEVQATGANRLVAAASQGMGAMCVFEAA